MSHGGDSMAISLTEKFVVQSPHVKYSDEFIQADYCYENTIVQKKASRWVATPTKRKISFRTVRTVPKVGWMLVGLGGNNGTTVTAGIIANREKINWNSKLGPQQPNYFGSVTQCSTVRLGDSSDGKPIFVPLKNLLPMVNPNDLVIGGWDINGMNLADAMKRAAVIDYDLQIKLAPYMKDMKPMPSIYYPDFIAANQASRADNVLPGDHCCKEHLAKLRADIRNFKAANKLDKVIVLWTANTERFCDVRPGINDTADNLLRSIERGEREVSQSTMFACAAILEGCSFLNGSPQNTLVAGVVDLAHRCRVFIGGDDLKTGQTKLKSVMVDFLVSAGIKPESVVSYNHLGNNDGKNLSAPSCFRSKEISKSSVIDDMVQSNSILYPKGSRPDHCVVIKYVPAVGDSKRALDEYFNKIFLNGLNTIALHNTCEDSLLAAPVMIDMTLVMELFERVYYRTPDMPADQWERFHPVCTVLSYLFKAPIVPQGTPVVNSLFRQRECLQNILRACLGLRPENYMMLEQKTKILRSRL